MEIENLEDKIDFVILWVDGNDKEWLKEKSKYLRFKGDSEVNRYRDCDNLQYLFRGIERYAPWVNKIFFITWGHLPKWLDTDNEKLVVVKHEDFIPKEYLPTFNSNVIELNLHRIDALSEKFVLFNDDLFILKETNPEDFFIGNKPTDVFVEYLVLPSKYKDYHCMMISNIMALINQHFCKQKCYEKNMQKYINPKYGNLNKVTEQTKILKNKFVGFWNFHAPQSYLKQTFRAVWEKETKNLNEACKNKFRNYSDLGHYMCRYWQLASGNFEPKKDESKYLAYQNDNTENIKELESRKYKYVCINDVYIDIDFKKSKMEINDILNKLLPEKSKFEL